MGVEYLDIRKAAKILNCTERHVRRICEKGVLSGSIKSDRWKIPVTASAKLTGIKTPDEMLSSEELLDVPAGKRKEAFRRLGMIRNFEKFSASFVHNGGTRTEAMKIYASKHHIGKRSLERWIAHYRQQGLLGLVDTRGGGAFFCQIISPDAFELFKSMYLTQQRLSLKTCWQNICYVNRTEDKGWKIPSLQYMYKYVPGQIPLFAQVLHREGLAAYEAKCAPYVQVDPDSIRPGQVWVGDHSQFNCWVRHRGKWIRPWITAWMDMRSRIIVGYHIAASPNQTTILLAMKRGIEKHGPPETVKIDNGRDYDSELWTGTTKAKRKVLNRGYIDEQMVAGIYSLMDIAVSFAIPYHPQSKPIERFFDTLDRQFTKTIKTYCGKDSERKPDYLNDLLRSEKTIQGFYDIKSFTGIVGQYIKAYNNTAHTGVGMDGRSPAEVMATRESRRVLAEGVLDLLMRVWSGELTVSKNGVKFKGMWYGQYNTELLMYQGKKVRVAYDPDDLRALYIYDAVTLKLITLAEQNQLVCYGSPVGEESLREAMRQKAKAVKIARQFRDSRLTANTDLTSLTIKAMQEGKKEEKPTEKYTSLRPVRTLLDDQVRDHKRAEVLKAVKKAAGAESLGAVLDMDFTLLSRKKNKYAEVKLFNE